MTTFFFFLAAFLGSLGGETGRSSWSCKEDSSGGPLLCDGGGGARRKGLPDDMADAARMGIERAKLRMQMEVRCEARRGRLRHEQRCKRIG